VTTPAPALANHRRAATGVRLNLGCGTDVRPGWVNVDRTVMPGIEVVTDFDDSPHLPFNDGQVGYSEGAHVIEHLRNPLPFMAELWRVTRGGGQVVFACPYGSTDDADEDPTHVRRMFPGSWGYFSQPYYHRVAGSYGYTGDWQLTDLTLAVFPEFSQCTDPELWSMIRFQRNVVAEQVAKLRCVKPARKPLRELQEKFALNLERRTA
jgi:SAM-dependent methyltransferase